MGRENYRRLLEDQTVSINCAVVHFENEVSAQLYVADDEKQQQSITILVVNLREREIIKTRAGVWKFQTEYNVDLSQGPKVMNIIRNNRNEIRRFLD